MPAGKEHQRQGNCLSGSCHSLATQSLPQGCPGHPPHPIPWRWWAAETGAKRRQQGNITTTNRSLPQGSAGTRRVTAAPAGCGSSTGLNMWLCRESSAQAAGVLRHPQSPPTFPAPAPLSANLAATAKTKPRAAVTGRLQPCNQKGSRERGTSFNSGRLLHPDAGHSGAVTQAAITLPYFLQHRQQKAGLVRATPASRAAVSPARRQALRSRRQHVHHSCPASSLAAQPPNCA